MTSNREGIDAYTIESLARERDELRAERDEALVHSAGLAQDINELRAKMEWLEAKEIELRDELVRLRGQIWDLTHPA